MQWAWLIGRQRADVSLYSACVYHGTTSLRAGRLPESAQERVGAGSVLGGSRARRLPQAGVCQLATLLCIGQPCMSFLSPPLSVLYAAQ
jgi:hypothetical protein